MRRVLVLFLSVVLLFSFIPFNVEGASFTKDIDVFFGNFEINISGKTIVNHKEPFLYDEELFVSLTDLAKGLDMNINISKDNVHLTSKGKLNFNPDSSNKSIVFQRGYEIMAKERIAENIEDEINVLSGKGSNGTNNNIKGNIKSIKVGFGGTSIYLDGKKLNLDTLPLKYKNDIFISIDSIAPYLYITPSLSKDKATIDIDANGVLVKDSYYSTIDALLTARENRNYLLDIQRAELNRKKHILEDLKLPYKKILSITSLENYLNDKFNTVGELSVKLDVTKQSNWINLDISFPNNKNYLWYRLKRSDVEQWIWNIYTAVLNLYDENALISGVIRNPSYYYYSNYNLNNYVTFYTRDKDIYFDFSKSKLNIDYKINPNYLVEHLNANLPRYYSMDINYEAKMSGDNIELIVRPSSNDFSKISIYAKMGYLKSLNQRIKLLYPDLVIEGKIIYPDEKIEPLDFYIYENRVRSLSLLDETADMINNYFGVFVYNNFTFRLDYSLHEKDLRNFHLYGRTDFSQSDDRWKNGEEVVKERFNTTIQNALSYISSLWDANVYTEILDNNGDLIYEYNFFQENVSVIYATPASGAIPEGTRVYLYTTTPEASIYYTTDGSTPTTYSQLYDGKGIVITRDMEINAIGYRDGLGAGQVSTFNYTVIRDQGLSYGLTNLTINPGSLVFSNNTLHYSVNVDSDASSITITPYATSGVIKVGNDVVVSGQPKVISLNNGANTITISVKETDKRERVYTIIVNRGTGGSQDVFIVDNLRFDLILYNLVFRGKVHNSNIQDFSGYKVKLLTGTNKLLKTITVSSDGNFSFTGKLDVFDTLFGFRYEVLDGSDKVVFKDTIN